jgi:hypothetical protein
MSDRSLNKATKELGIGNRKRKKGPPIPSAPRLCNYSLDPRRDVPPSPHRTARVPLPIAPRRAAPASFSLPLTCAAARAICNHHHPALSYISTATSRTFHLALRKASLSDTPAVAPRGEDRAQLASEGRQWREPAASCCAARRCSRWPS